MAAARRDGAGREIRVCPAMPARLPTIAIVGRPNVGKSALFNRLAARRIAIVHDQPGVTRDRLFAPCAATTTPAQLVDTGGIGATLDDGFAGQVRAEADVAIETADIILFTVDGQEGLHPIDQTLAAELRRTRAPVALVVNKIDDPKHDTMPDEFTRLGFHTLLPISAAHGRGFTELLDWLDDTLAKLPAESAAATDEAESESAAAPLKLAIVGRPNVGKSSLVNALLGSQRTIVSEIAGTTRDAIDVPLSNRGKDYLLIDTAGLRPRSKRDTSVEVFSAMRTEQSIRRADIVALVIDSAQGITAMDRKIAGTILDAAKPCVIVLNKYDLFHPGGPTKERIEELTDQIRRELFFLSYAPFVALSAKEKQHLGKFFQSIEKVREASRATLPTGPLNRLLQDGIVRTAPPLVGNKRFKLLYATSATATDDVAIPVPDHPPFHQPQRPAHRELPPVSGKPRPRRTPVPRAAAALRPQTPPPRLSPASRPCPMPHPPAARIHRAARFLLACLPLLAAVSCASIDREAKKPLATIDTMASPAAARQAVVSVFGRNGFKTIAPGTNPITFESPATRAERLAYKDWAMFDDEIIDRAFVELTPLPQGTRLQVRALILSRPNTMFEDAKFPILGARVRYKNMLEQAAAEASGLPAMPARSKAKRSSGPEYQVPLPLESF